MAQAKMSKIGLVAPTAVKERLLHALQIWEVLQLSNLREKIAATDLALGLATASSSLGEVEARQADVGFALAFLRRFEVVNESLIDSFMGLKAVVTPEQLVETVEKFAAETTVNQCKLYEKRLGEIQNERSRFVAERALLANWVLLDIAPQSMSGASLVGSAIGTVSPNDLAAFERRLDTETGGLYHLEKIAVDNRLVNVVIVYFGGEAPAVLRESIFNQVTLPLADMSPRVADIGLQSSLAELASEERQILQSCTKLLEHKVQLQTLFDHYGHIIQREQAIALGTDTAHTFVVEGWIETARLGELEAELAKSFSQVVMLKSEVSAQDVPPVKLQNSNLVRPFEFVTNVYGNPMHSEVDPTPLLAPFFALFFALSLGDAGYGLILVAGSWWLMRKYKPELAGRKFFHLFALVGLLSVVSGLAMNGFFGNLIDLMPFPALIALKNNFVLVDPMTAPMTIMILSLALGVVHVFLGIAVKGYMTFTGGDRAGALMDQGSWLFLILALVLQILATVLPTLSHLAPALGNVSILGAVLVVLAQGRAAKGIFSKLGTGLYALYGGVGYFSDVLSYTRILALGLSSAVIAVVINTIAGMVVAIPVVGWPLAAVIFVAGHLFNVVLSTLGCFIHSARLQFVEFFTKFFEGGGQSFKPLRLASKFIVIK